MSDLEEMAVVEKKNNKILREIELEIRKGQMVAIIGDVGCGKSSVLFSLIGEMKNTGNPTLHVNGKFGIVN